MRYLPFCFLLVLATLIVPVHAADVGVSVSVGQPGFYGQIDIGNVERPPVIYAQPMVIVRPPRDRVVEPLYLRVPPGHAKHWRKHCAKYDACGRPVYFVRDDWYNNVYAPRYREEHREGHRNDKHDRDHGNNRDDH